MEKVEVLIYLINWLVYSTVTLAVLGVLYQATRLFVKHYIYPSSSFDDYITYRKDKHARENNLR